MGSYMCRLVRPRDDAPHTRAMPVSLATCERPTHGVHARGVYARLSRYVLFGS